MGSRSARFLRFVGVWGGWIIVGLLTLVCIFAALTTTGYAESMQIDRDVQEWADYAQVDPVDLQGAVNETGLTPEDYLVDVGEVIRQPAVTVATIGPAAYIASHSRYGQRAACVSRIETGNWTAFWNPRSWGRYGEHAQGYFGWLPSTAASVGLYSIMDIDAEIAAFDRMMDRGRGNEFAGVLMGIC